MYKIEYFETLTPMKYYDNPEPKTDTLKQKRQDMIDNKDNLYIATEKHELEHLIQQIFINHIQMS